MPTSVPAADDRIPMIGSRLGHYEITAKLGEGGMGEVCRATDTKLKRDTETGTEGDIWLAELE